MERRSNGIVYYALIIAVVALVISLAAYAGRGKLQPAASPRVPTILRLSMVVATFTGQGMAAHRWYPTMLVVRRGDTVDLAVGNPDKFNHRFEITGYNQMTKKLTPGSTDTVHFIADQGGVFVYRCMLPHDPAKGDYWQRALDCARHAATRHHAAAVVLGRRALGHSARRRDEVTALHRRMEAAPASADAGAEGSLPGQVRVSRARGLRPPPRQPGSGRRRYKTGAGKERLTGSQALQDRSGAPRGLS